MKLKKSYMGFVVWMILFCAASVGVSFLPIRDSSITTRIVYNICAWGITLLAFIIYKTEYVYWYNGTSYEEAVEAGSERRKRYAWMHFKRFALFSIVFFLFSILAKIFVLSFWIDTVVFLVGFIGVAISTIWIKL
ncbi:MAG: hypothetical protein Q4E73_01730 [Lachnospiraceae bacterium]|nr:hypothetical protein [Lachnospiraceae bacterium]